MELKDIFLSPVTRKLLEENGRSDRAHGIDMHAGWGEICKEVGYSPYERTPAHEAYLDGYYAPIK